MRAARIFVEDLRTLKVLDRVHSLRAELYGSLALTGEGHGTLDAVLMGLEGETPESIDTTSILPRSAKIHSTNTLSILSHHQIHFNPKLHLLLHRQKSLPEHPNGMRFSAFSSTGDLLATNEYFSIGGGFVVNDHTKTEGGENAFYMDTRLDHAQKLSPEVVEAGKAVPFGHGEQSLPKPQRKKAMAKRREQKTVVAALPFSNAAELLDVCKRENHTIAEVVYRNELQWRSPEEIRSRVLNIWKVMDQSIVNGISAPEGLLPGHLSVRRRAPGLYKRLMEGLQGTEGGDMPSEAKGDLPANGGKREAEVLIHARSGGPPALPVPLAARNLPALDWMSLYAIAVNEENAAGGRVVTAPTNGAAGVIPSTLKFYLTFLHTDPSPRSRDNAIITFLLTSAAIGMLYKRGASISAAEVGCQGEVGVACSMAAAGLCAVMGGGVGQVENAAEGKPPSLPSTKFQIDRSNTPLFPLPLAPSTSTQPSLTCDPVGGLVQIPCIERNTMGAVKALTAAQLALHGDGVHRVSLDQVIETMRQTGVDMMSKYKETSLGGLAVNVPMC
ncbi:hypothetical protein HDV00_006595 [Rhizophlyctis rosea]|nr:hypothetical protein HDV00_006595 [Rhizophlyctis rosea]